MASLKVVYEQFLKKIEDLEEKDNDGQTGFSQQFAMLRETSSSYKLDKNYPTKAGQLPMNKVKNRFKDILPFDSTRVVLPTTSAEGSDYINANYIKGINNDRAYIASQGPLPNTVNDFWRMLWTFNIKVIVMLCRTQEKGKKKCQQYWPEETEEKLKFNGISVKTNKSVSVGHNFTMRTLVAECEGEEHILTQFHYTAWPDHGVPTTTAPMIELLKLVREYQPEDNPPIVFHCSAGCGRTGTICALDYTYSLIKKMRSDEVDPYKIVYNLRKQRHAMVQTKSQYEYMCWAMCALFRAKLNLPIEEELESHLYENVTNQNYSDSDSDASLSPAVKSNSDPFRNKLNKKDKCPVFVLGQNSSVLPKSLESNKKKTGQLAQPGSSDSYVNVSFNGNLIDLSDTTDGDSTKNTPITGMPARATNKPSQVVDNGLHKALVKFPEKTVGGKGNTAVRQDSSENYVFPERPTNAASSGQTSAQLKGLHFSGSDAENYNQQGKPPSLKQKFPEFSFDETSDYVFVPTRGNQSPTKTVNPPVDKTKKKLDTSQSYENVLPVGFLPKVQSQSVAAPAVPNKPGNPEKKRGMSQLPLDKSSKPTTLPAKPTIPRRKSATMDVKKPVIGAHEKKPATFSPKTGVDIASALKRAKVLPNESLDDNEAQRQQAFFEDVNSGLYAQVKRRNKSSNRKELNDQTFKNVDSVDGDQPPAVPKKLPEIFLSDEQHDANHEAKSKTSSLTNKFTFLSKKPEFEAQVIQLENIGYGVRLSKPKGPRNPPKSWMVK